MTSFYFRSALLRPPIAVVLCGARSRIHINRSSDYGSYSGLTDWSQIASIFSFAIRVNISNRPMAVATALAYDKMEELKWTACPAGGTDQITLDDTFIRIWQSVPGDSDGGPGRPDIREHLRSCAFRIDCGFPRDVCGRPHRFPRGMVQRGNCGHNACTHRRDHRFREYAQRCRFNGAVGWQIHLHPGPGYERLDMAAGPADDSHVDGDHIHSATGRDLSHKCSFQRGPDGLSRRSHSIFLMPAASAMRLPAASRIPHRPRGERPTKSGPTSPHWRLCTMT